MTKEVEESTEYDNFLEESKEAPKRSSLDAFVKTKEVTAEDSDKWELHWVGQPDFKQDEKKPFRRVTITFRNQDDVDEFAKSLDLKMTDKTKSVWYPLLAKDANSLKRWMQTD